MSHSVTVNSISKAYLLRKAKRKRFALRKRSKQGDKSAREDRVLWALKDVSFNVDEGSALGVIGPNGAGKSTLLKILARITHPTEGKAVIKGRVVSLLEIGAAFHPEYSGRQNILLNAALYGIPRKTVEDEFESIVEFAGLDQVIDSPVKYYSSGMYLRLAFSTAMHMRPDVLLADEVLAVGDISFQEQCIRQVEQLRSNGTTVLFVSHDMEAVRRICDRVIWLNSGKIVMDGDPLEVTQKYEEGAWTMLSEGDASGNDSNEYGELLSITLRSSSGSQAGSVRVDEDCFIAVRYRVKQPKVTVRCALGVATGGVTAFHTVEPEESELAPGVYESAVLIPAHLLLDTVYSVKCGIWTGKVADQPVALVRDNALTFRVYNPDEERSARGTYTNRLGGVVMPKLDWMPSRLDAPSQ